MRLIDSFSEEKEAFTLYSFLLKEGIENVYESFFDPTLKKRVYQVWVYDEEDADKAFEWAQLYKKQPEDPKFQRLDQVDLLVSSPRNQPSLKPPVKWTSSLTLRPKITKPSLTLTSLLLFVCIALFFWNQIQEVEMIKSKGLLALEFSLTPVQRTLLFDYPKAMAELTEWISQYPIQSIQEIKSLPMEAQDQFKAANQIPAWKGFYEKLLQFFSKKPHPELKAPLFEKIREGQVWRLFTPCLLHRDFLHILFNMAWLWVLGKQIENRLGKWKMTLLILLIGVLSNVGQYLMSGPYFLGFSGVVVGMTGFIWMRQKIAPWEGYPLHAATGLFILIFVGAMLALEGIAFFLQIFSITDLAPNIANTAHIIGGISGISLGRMPFFSRGDG